ncbi:peptidoglycan editing factor PgeF [Alteraurantiacibacter palmitatis]|uniref:Purine nucleoside phosphorylase n=1 Tax=Alteraurantiacibacter palmitatis TaxID=2054628 RepID=A0ABV7E5D2_9SPHN
MSKWRARLAEGAPQGRPVIRHAVLAGVPHGFFTGIGFANPDQNAPPDAGLVVPSGQLVRLRQVHSALALPVTAPFLPGEEPEGDALVTATPGLVLAVVTADCAPVLLADPVAGVVGAAHAGWRGAFGGVLENAVAAMEALGADRARIRAAIGPTIAQASYEVDAGFRQRLLDADPVNAAFFAPGARADHFQFDLPAYVRARLIAAGVGEVGDTARDTYADARHFHSFRRATHRGEPTYGRQFSAIGL